MLPLVAASLLAASPIPEIALDLRAGGSARAPAIAWQSLPDGAALGRAVEPAFEAQVRIGPPHGGSRTLEASIAWLRPIGVERVALRVRWDGAPEAVDRALRFRRVTAPLRVGRGTPVAVAAGEALLVGGEGVAGALVTPRPEGGRPGVEVTLLADDADDRPFATYPDCIDRVDGAQHHGQWGALERKVAHREAPRRAGDLDRFGAALVALDPDRPARPVVVERWPSGARGAVTFTDHADRTDGDALEAILWGRTGAAGSPGHGFLGRGLRITRSFFVHADVGGLDDPQAAAAADALVAGGSEVALHSITEGRDDRAAVAVGLLEAARWRPETWIDHQPYTNCEAFSSRGWRTDGPHGVKDELVRLGIRWVWAAGDVAGFKALEVANVLAIGDEAAASPAIYPFPFDPALWVFQSSFFHDAPERLAEALSGVALERLEGERGLFVGHTYLGAGARETPAGRNRERLAVVRLDGGGLALHPALDAALARIEERVDAGALASLTWAEAGDRLRALGDVGVAYRDDGAAEIDNRGGWPLDGLTIAVPEEGLDLSLEGAGPLLRHDLPGWSRASFDLPPHGRAILRATRGGAIIALP
jgi:hypothetical protein